MKYTIEHEGEHIELDLLPPYDCLTAVYGLLRDVNELPGDEARPDLLRAYELANIALGSKELTTDQEALLSLFFTLGFKMGKQVTTYPKLEAAIAVAIKDRTAKSNGGKHSPWKNHEAIILKYLSEYEGNRRFTEKMALQSINNETGMEVSAHTFRSWVKRYRADGSIFK